MMSPNSNTKKIAFHKLKCSEWSDLPAMNAQREGGAAVAIQNSKILVIGGYHEEQKFLKSCVVFDLTTQKWSDYPPMKTSRMGCAAVYLEQHNAVVVVGGFHRGRKYLNTAEYLNLSTLKWHRLPPMRDSRAGCAAVTVLGKRVVVLGGWKDGETASSTVEVLDFTNQQWHFLPEMNSPRAGCVAAAVGHRVLVLGGHTTTGTFRGCRSSVEMLDLSTNTWSRLPSMKAKRDASACCVLGTYVMVIGGGETSVAPVNTAEILEVEERIWRDLPNMRSRRFGCSAAIVGDRLIVLGGRSGDGKHLETVECLNLPMVDETDTDLKTFLQKAGASSSNKPDTGGLSMTETSTVDRERILQTFETIKTQAHEQYGRTVNALQQRLAHIEKERQKIQERLNAAKHERDQTIARAEEEKRESLKDMDFKKKQTEQTSAPGRLYADEAEPPSELCCCITGELMSDPVTAMDGHTYERSAIESWYARFPITDPPTSPLSGEPIPSRRLIPSHNIRSQCKTWREKLGLTDEDEFDPLSKVNGTAKPTPVTRPTQTMQRRNSGSRRVRSSSTSRRRAAGRGHAPSDPNQTAPDNPKTFMRSNSGNRRKSRPQGADPPARSSHGEHPPLQRSLQSSTSRPHTPQRKGQP